MELLCGLDEAGRGPMAGPVCAAAVILPETFDVSVLNDSKKLSASARERAMIAIYRDATAWCVAWASAEEIDRLNILKASLLAMKRAYEGLLTKLPAELPSTGIRAVVDGLYIPQIDCPRCQAVVKADSIYPAVMAASILAKTARDRMMIRYGWLYPEWGYEQHKGYPTPNHIKALASFGPSPIQRRSFKLKGADQLSLF